MKNENRINNLFFRVLKKAMLQASCFKLHDEKGFTLIEMLFVLATIAILSTILIAYSRTGERQIIVFRDQTKIINALLRAKSLSLATFGKAGVPCGYGVHFEKPRTFIIFKDIADDCSQADHKYSGSNEIVESMSLDRLVAFGDLTLSDVVFIPPDPIVIITPDQDPATLTIKAGEGASSAVIRITKAGQIST